MEEIQKSESLEYSYCASDLPTSLILEIILKLPIKSVIQCRCVCKNWNALISETHFATLYFRNPPFTVLVKFIDYIVEDRPVNQSSCFIEIGLNGDITCTPFNPRAMNFQRTGGLFGNGRLAGSCKGLLCLVQSQIHESMSYYDFNNDALSVINPLLGEVMILPQINQSEGIEFVFYGFGFSTHSDHYKVVRFVSMSVGDIHGEIFTIGVDHKWRSFEDSSIPFYLYPYPITLNGFLYYVADEMCLFAFDIEEERGHIILLPSEFGDESDNIVLGVFNGNLCLCDNSSKHQVVIWTMKGNGVVESWSRKIILKSWIPLDLSSDQLIPITTLRNGDLLMSCHSSLFDKSKFLISYNSKTNECHKLEFSDGEEDCSYFYRYVPSFFPLSTVLRNDTNI